MNIGLRAKILLGYMLVSLLIMVVGGIAAYQFMSVGSRVSYLTNEVAVELDIANRIRSEVLSMRTSVEKFIYKNREEDRQAAEQHISNLHGLLNKASETLYESERTVKLQEIDGLTSEYIDKFKKVSIRMEAREKNVNELITFGRQAEGALHKAVQENQGDLTLLNLCLDSLVKFVAAEISVNRFLADNDPRYADEAKQILTGVAASLASVGSKEFENLGYDVEDYGDLFAGLVSISQKMDLEIQKTLLPLAPRIVALADEVSDSGRREMAKAQKDVEGRINATGRIILFIVTGAVLFGFVLGFVLSGNIIKSVSRVVQGLTEGSVRMNQTSAQLSSLSLQVADGSSSQAASLEQASASLEQILSMTRNNDNNASQANSLMIDTNSEVEKAEEAVQELSNSIEKISRANEETFKIIKTIEGIAFQTNLLALNAAVEAARAGEAGAGFAVVADEVRSLASRAAEAAADSTGLIEETSDLVGQGGELMARTNEIFSDLSRRTNEIGSLINEIALASNEQAKGVEQVSETVAQIDSVVQENAANAEESAAASEELKKNALDSQSYVSELVLLLKGRKSLDQDEHQETLEESREMISS